MSLSYRDNKRLEAMTEGEPYTVRQLVSLWGCKRSRSAYMSLMKMRSEHVVGVQSKAGGGPGRSGLLYVRGGGHATEHDSWLSDIPKGNDSAMEVTYLARVWGVSYSGMRGRLSSLSVAMPGTVKMERREDGKHYVWH